MLYKYCVMNLGAVFFCWQFDMQCSYATHLAHPVLCSSTHFNISGYASALETVYSLCCHLVSASTAWWQKLRDYITVRSHRRRRERQSGRKSFIFNVSQRRAPARAARRVLDGESVEESWNQVSFMVMSYDAVRQQPIGM